LKKKTFNHEDWILGQLTAANMLLGSIEKTMSTTGYKSHKHVKDAWYAINRELNVVCTSGRAAKRVKK